MGELTTCQCCSWTKLHLSYLFSFFFNHKYIFWCSMLFGVDYTYVVCILAHKVLTLKKTPTHLLYEIGTLFSPMISEHYNQIIKCDI